MASTSVALRLARRTIWDELRPILVGLGDNIFQTPKPRRRRSAAPHPPPYLITDGGVPGIIFRKPVLFPVLVISPDHIRFVIGPGAVIDRVHGWEYVCFDRRVGANPFDWRIIVFLLAAAGATAFIFYCKRLREDDGPGGSGRRGPGPGGRSRFRRSLGLLDVLGVGRGGGDAGRGRFRRSLGLLEVLGGGGGGGGGVEGCAGGGGGTGPQDRESSAELQDSTEDGVVARYSHEFPQEAEAYSSQRCDWIELFLPTECISQVQGDWETSMRLMHNLYIPEGDNSEVAGGVKGCSSSGGGTGPQDSLSDDNLASRYSCLTSASLKSLLQLDGPEEAEAYSSQSCDWIELLVECIISQGNWDKTCTRLVHHLGSPEGDSSEVLSACDSSAKERAGGHLSPRNVQVCRG